MPPCPNCATPLRTVRQRGGVFYLCDRCAGRALTLPQLRRVAGDRFATGVLHQINNSAWVPGRTCPFCADRMRRFSYGDPVQPIDSCRKCGVVWLEANQVGSIPEGGLENSDDLEAFAHEILSQDKAKRIREGDDDVAISEIGWKALPSLLGFPVEIDETQSRGIPLATLSLTALVIIISLCAFANIHEVAVRFGFIPAEAWRYGGLTFLTCFFLHGGWLHLIGNMYFLLVFGRRVENQIGHWRFLLLIFLATIGGNLLHLAIQFNSTIPGIGASGGISGVIVFYALRFPRARLGLFIRFRWVTIPAWAALFIWMLYQGFLAVMQAYGFSNVNSFAHLGGAAMGFAAWLLWRKAGLQPSTSEF
jgi:membrane associated rhomboid family serine protease